MMNTKTAYKQKYEELEKSLFLGSILHAFASGIQDPDKIPGFIAAGMGLYGAHKLNQKYGKRVREYVKDTRKMFSDSMRTEEPENPKSKKNETDMKNSYAGRYRELEKGLFAGLADPTVWPWYAGTALAGAGAIKYGPKALKAVNKMIHHFHQANDVSAESDISETPQKNVSALIPKDKRTKPMDSVEKSFDMETMARLTGKSIERIQNDISHADFLGNSAFKEPERIANPQQGVAERMLVAEYTPPINNDLMNDNFNHQMSLISNLSHDEVIAKLSRAEFNGNPFYQGKKNV